MKNKKISRSFPFIYIHTLCEFIKKISKKRKSDQENSKMLDNYAVFVEQSRHRNMPVPQNECVIYQEATAKTNINRDYTYHMAWATRVLNKTKPARHVDISSSTNFVSIASAIAPIDFYDFRPAEIELDNLNCLAADITRLPFDDNSISSISSLSVLEHIGLGRYGDPIDGDGDLKGINELKRVTAVGGNLLVNVTLCNSPKVIYNAHRLYNPKQFIGYFTDTFELVEFAMVGRYQSDGGLIYSPTQEQLDTQKDEYYGCFWFRKIK